MTKCFQSRSMYLVLVACTPMISFEEIYIYIYIHTHILFQFQALAEAESSGILQEDKPPKYVYWGLSLLLYFVNLKEKGLKHVWSKESTKCTPQLTLLIKEILPNQKLDLWDIFLKFCRSIVIKDVLIKRVMLFRICQLIFALPTICDLISTSLSGMYHYNLTTRRILVSRHCILSLEGIRQSFTKKFDPAIFLL